MTKELRSLYYENAPSYFGSNRCQEVVGDLLGTSSFFHVNLNRPNLEYDADEETNALDAWAIEHMTGEYIVFRNSGYFANEADATLFKLRWYDVDVICE